jgi:hypothetical protein
VPGEDDENEGDVEENLELVEPNTNVPETIANVIIKEHTNIAI